MYIWNALVARCMSVLDFQGWTSSLNPSGSFFDRWGDLVVQLELDVNNLSASSALPRRYLILTFRCFSIFV